MEQNTPKIDISLKLTRRSQKRAPFAETAKPVKQQAPTHGSSFHNYM